jgi:hypothetical protein
MLERRIAGRLRKTILIMKSSVEEHDQIRGLREEGR